MCINNSQLPAQLIEFVQTNQSLPIIVVENETIVDANCVVPMICGYAREEIIGKPLGELIVPLEQPSQHLYPAEMMHAAHPPTGIVNQIICKDGSKRQTNAIRLPWNSDLQYSIIALQDVSHHFQAISSFKESEAKFKTVFDASAMGIVLTNSSGNPVITNKAFQKMTGYSEEELQGITWEDIMHPDDLEKAAKPALSMLAGEIDEFHMDKRFICKNGETKWVRLTASAVRDIDGSVKFIVSMLVDITKQKAAAEAIKQSYSELEQANEMQRSFLNNITHDIRTPLTSVQGYAEMLLEGIAGGLNEEQARLIKKIITNSNHLLEMVNGVLEIARLKSGKAAADPVTCNPIAIIGEVIETLLPQAAMKSLALNYLHPQKSCLSLYDHHKIAVIASNLISNAVKFTEKGSVDVFAECDAGGAELIVCDTGIGINPNDFGRIFDEFEQLSSNRTRKACESACNNDPHELLIGFEN